jgi:hypothetical protein
MKITTIFERFILFMWKHLNFQLFCFCYSVVNMGSVFTEAQPGSTLRALCFEIAYSLLRKIVEREFQILTLMNFHEPLEIKCNFQQPSSSDSPLPKKGTQKISKKKVYFILILSSTHFHLMRDRQGSIS